MKWWALGVLMQLPALLIWALDGYWTPRFPRAWRGRRVTVQYGLASVQADQMAAIRRDRFEVRSSPYPHSLHAFYFKDEGLTWCLGWKGPQVNALKVVVAMREAA